MRSGPSTVLAIASTRGLITEPETSVTASIVPTMRRANAEVDRSRTEDALKRKGDEHHRRHRVGQQVHAAQDFAEDRAGQDAAIGARRLKHVEHRRRDNRARHHQSPYPDHEREDVEVAQEEHRTDYGVPWARMLLTSGRRRSRTSSVAYPEARAAFARGRRDRRFTAKAFSEIKRSFEHDWQAISVRQLDSDLAHAAGELAERYALRGFDGIHLASFLDLRRRNPDILFSSFDARLNRAARSAVRRGA